MSGINLVVIDSVHEKTHDGDHFFIGYSVPSMGAMAAPDDMITLSWKTPKRYEIHLTYEAKSSSGARVRLIEGKTGAGVSPTGVLQTYNSNRNSSKTSRILDVAGGNASQVSYDATLFTGGVPLIDEYIGADGQGASFAAGESRGDVEIILKQDTFYQLSIYETDTVPGALKLSFYEDTPHED